MTLTRKRLIISMFIVVLMVVFTNNSLVARSFANYSDEGFCTPCDPCDPCEGGTSGGSSLSGVKGNFSLTTLVIQGAGHYLKAYSGALLVVNKAEMSDLYGVNFDEFNQLLDQAIIDTQLTLETYAALVNEANITPYNPHVINKLTAFDYRDFRNGKGLNANVFDKVEHYLEKGNIRGTYSYILSKLDGMLGMLNKVKDAAVDNKLPDNELIWRINQEFSETLLFGQYSAEVFYKLLRQ